MTIDFTQIILAVIALLSTVLTTVLVPFIKSKLDVTNGKITENQAAMIKLAIKTAVTAAEQLYYSEEGEKKKAYVVALLKGQGIDVDLPSIDAAIEAAVLELHNQLKKE